MATLTDAIINERIERAFDYRWDVCIGRSERSVRSVRSIFNSTWDRIRDVIRRGTDNRWSYRQAFTESTIATAGFLEEVEAVIESNLSEQIQWGHSSAIDAFFGPMPDEYRALVYDEVLREAKRQRIGLRGMRRILPPPDESRVREILEKHVNGMTWRKRLDKSSRIISNKSELVRRIAAGIAAGKTPSEIRASILPLVNNVKTSATRIVRTEMRRVANAIAEDVWEKSDKVIVGYRRRSQRDGKVRPTHVIADGLYYPKGKRRPSLPDAPNCRCFYVVIFGIDKGPPPKKKKPKPKPKPTPKPKPAKKKTAKPKPKKKAVKKKKVVKPPTKKKAVVKKKKVRPKPKPKVPKKKAAKPEPAKIPTFELPEVLPVPKYESKPVFDQDWEKERAELVNLSYEARMKKFRSGDAAVKLLKDFPDDPEIDRLEKLEKELEYQGRNFLYQANGDKTSDAYKTFEAYRDHRVKLRDMRWDRMRARNEAAYRIVEPPKKNQTEFVLTWTDAAKEEVGSGTFKTEADKGLKWAGRMRRADREHDESYRMHPNVAKGYNTMYVTLDYTDSRAHMHPNASRMNVGRMSPATTYIHEMGHTYEIEGKTLRMTGEFLDKRFGTNKQKLNDALGVDVYRDDEITRGDDKMKELFEKIKGRESSAFYAGKDYGGGATELISMGMELLYLDPVEFAKRDPEYFKLVVGSLQGALD